MVSKKYFLPAIALAIALVLAYSNIFEGQYILDDEFLLQKNKLLQSWSELWRIFTLSSTGGAGGIDSFYRPIQTLSYFIFTKLFGASFATYHSLNLLLHFLNCFLVYLLALRLEVRAWPAFFAALLWGLHPIHTEAVTYMSATADPLHSFFCLLGLTILLPELSFRKIVFSVPVFLMALLSKEAAIVFPGLVCLLIFIRDSKPWRFRIYLKTAPLWLCAVGYLIARQTILNFNDTFNFYKTNNIYTESLFVRVLTSLSTIPKYIELLLWPHDLHLERSFEVATEINISVWIGIIVLVVLLLLAAKNLKSQKKIIVFGLLWAMIVHSPQSGILIPVNAFFLEHWMYLVSIGPIIGIFGYLQEKVNFENRKALTAVPIFTVAATFGALTWKQNLNWKDPVTFYEYVLKVEPKPPPRLYNNLAMAYSDKGRKLEAKNFYQIAISMSDTYPQTRHNLGLLLLAENQSDLAIKNFQRALEIDPHFYHSMIILEKYYRQLGQKEKAEEFKRKIEVEKLRFHF